MDIDLDDDGEELVLKDAFGNDIDTADGSGGWQAGEDGDEKKSMERNDTPSTGWHTCIDPDCNNTDFWDSEGDNYGTPKAENKSENDPSENILEELGEPVLDEVPDLSEELAKEEEAQKEKGIQQEEIIVEEEESTEEQTEEPEEEKNTTTEEDVVEETEIVEEKTNE